MPSTIYRAKSRFPPVCLWCHTNHLIPTKVGIKCRQIQSDDIFEWQKVTIYSTQDCTAQGTDFERVTTYTYLGFLIEQNLSFKLHTENVVSKLKIKWGFFYRNKSCFSFQTRKHLISATCIRWWWSAIHECLWAVPKELGYCVPLCLTIYYWMWISSTLYWPSLSARRLSHWLGFIYKSLLGLVPSYICTYMCQRESLYGLRSQDFIQMLVPTVRTKLGKTAIKYAAPTAWNNVQKELKLSDLITMGEFRGQRTWHHW